MTDISAPTELNKKTVAAVANQCLEAFNKCLLRESSIHPREFSLVEDQVARFSTWTSGIGVFAPGRASMDHRLRYAPEVQSIAISLLESLNYRIQKLLELLHGPEAHIFSIFDERLGKLLDYIAKEISHLNKMSNIIRKASQDSQNTQARDFHMTDEEGNDLQPILLRHYKRYISERFPAASITIQQRLANTMILQRKRIMYRRSRYGGTAIQLPKVENKVSNTLPDSRPRLEDNQKPIAPSRIKSATTLQPEKFKMAASSPSVVSTTMTVALGNHEVLKFPTAPGLHTKRKYEQFKAEQLAANQAMLGKADEPSSIADPTLSDTDDMRDAKRRLSTEQQLSKIFKPDVPAIGEVTCPYCFCTLSLEEVFNEKKWQNHVKNDLDPYVCLFEECGEPDELYKHSEKWLSHMNQHIQRWRCPSHRELGLFPTCEEYMQHVRDVHGTKLNDNKLRALANRNARSLLKLFMSCPLCGKDESEIGTRLTDHIAGHLRSLAIMSLPIYYDEDISGDVGSDENSSSNSQPRSRSTVNLLDDEDILVIRSAKVSQLQKDQSESAWSSNKSDLGRSHVDDKHNMASLHPISGDSVVGNDLKAEAERDPMITQQMQERTPEQLQQVVHQDIMQHTSPMNVTTWQNQRMEETLDQVYLQMNGRDVNEGTDLGGQFERETFHKSPTEEAYSQAMANKTMDLSKTRLANEAQAGGIMEALAEIEALERARFDFTIAAPPLEPIERARFSPDFTCETPPQTDRSMATSQYPFDLFADTSGALVTSLENINPQVPRQTAYQRYVDFNPIHPPPSPTVLTRPIEDDDGEGDHKRPRLRLQPKNRDSRDSRDLKDLSNRKGPKKAQHDPTRHATTQPVVSQSTGSHRRGHFEGPAAYGVQQAQQLQQPAASGRPRAKSRPASYYAGQPPGPPQDMSRPAPYAPRSPPPGASGSEPIRSVHRPKKTRRALRRTAAGSPMHPDPQSLTFIGPPAFFSNPSPTGPSEALQVADQEMMHIRNQTPASFMNTATGGFQSSNEQIVVTEAASTASDPPPQPQGRGHPGPAVSLASITNLRAKSKSRDGRFIK